MAKRKSPSTKKIVNRRARHDYALDTELVAGIALSGRETKSLRMGHGNLRGAYVTLRGGEVWLVNATITGSAGISLSEQEQTQDRKLLLKKKEIDKLAEAKTRGRSIVPLELLTGGRFIKIKIAVGTGKKQHDKRQVIKKRDQAREAQAALKR